MSKQPLAIVCALAFTVGGAAAYVFEHQLRGTAGAQGAAEVSADVSRETRAASGAPAARPDEPVRPEEGAVSADLGDSAHRPGEVGGGSSYRGGKAGGDAGEPPSEVSNPPAGMRSRAAAGRRTFNRERAPLRYARAGGGQVTTSGRSVAGYTVGGVKKTGEGMKKAGMAVGRTFGKLGGVFHD